MILRDKTSSHMQCMRPDLPVCSVSCTCCMSLACANRCLLLDLRVGVRLQGSRRHYCIHKTVSKEQAVDEACDKLMQDDGGCRHANRANLLSNKSEKLKASCCSIQWQLRTSSCPLYKECSGPPRASTCLRRTQTDGAAIVAGACQCTYFCRTQVHDIEDLASEGRQLSACPYFASREFAHDAEIVFCPYSYLVRSDHAI